MIDKNVSGFLEAGALPDDFTIAIPVHYSG
jgi:hypothetical protein